MNAPAAATPFQSASLYVGDLHNEVTESLLFELFNRVGPVASIRVCRDSVTRRSLGYAYVNFHNVQDAERALDTMNFTEIKNKPCRIMWSQRDPSLRKSGVGNVFVRNLAASVDNKGLYDTFSVFGNILSCKVATDENGASKGYGYVHFETAEAAQDAIQKFNGTLVDDMEVHVGPFVRRQDRAGQVEWTNLYVKQFPAAWDENRLRELFAAHGTVTNVAINRDNTEGKSKGFGFVNMGDHASAVKAIEELNGKSLEDGEGGNFELYVSVAQKKVDRVKEIKGRLDALNTERNAKYQGMNLYVKNIADSITDEAFREAFSAYGTITSARIMREVVEPKASKGFGFVCFSSPEEATRAVTEMNGKLLGNKPLVVTLHQRRELRRAHLEATYAQQNGMRFPQGGAPGGGMGPMGGAPFMGGMYMQPPQQGGPGGFPGQPGMRPGMVPFPYQPQGGMGMQQGGPMGGRGIPPANMRGGANMQGPYGAQRGPAPGNYYPQPGANMIPPYMAQGGAGPMGPGGMQQAAMFKRGPMNQGGYPMPGGPMGGMMQQPGAMGGMAPQQQQQQQRRPQMGGQQMGGQQMQGGRGPMGQQQQPNRGYNGGNPQMQMQQQQQMQMRGNVKFNNQARNQQVQQGGQGMDHMQQQGAQGQQQQQGQQGQPKLDFSDAALASADPLTQKNMIGEHLYPLIYQHQPEQAGKITGMLLEMDNGELLNLIESPDALMSKIEEALAVLRNHKANSEQE